MFSATLSPTRRYSIRTLGGRFANLSCVAARMLLRRLEKGCPQFVEVRDDRGTVRVVRV